MFHNLGLMPAFSSQHDRFEVDEANAARTFLTDRGISLEMPSGADFDPVAHNVRHSAGHEYCHRSRHHRRRDAFFPTGHFALETHLQKFAVAMREFLNDHIPNETFS